jgi:hypothetical protein
MNLCIQISFRSPPRFVFHKEFIVLHVGSRAFVAKCYYNVLFQFITSCKQICFVIHVGVYRNFRLHTQKYTVQNICGLGGKLLSCFNSVCLHVLGGKVDRVQVSTRFLSVL